MNGMYQFGPLFPGIYSVSFSDFPAGYFPTGQNIGTDEAVDSDVDPISGQTPLFVYGGGMDNFDIDAGYLRLANVGDMVWLDESQDGIKDAAETGIGQKVDVRITGTDGLGRAVDRTTQANEAGIYFFDGLWPGEYKLTFTAPVQPAYVFTDANLGDGTNDSKVDPNNGMTAFFELFSGDNRDDQDAGLIPVAILPVEFGAFNATLINENLVHLDWSTLMELNNDYFIVEHSIDGVNWMAIDRVDGAGTTTIAQQYHSAHTTPAIGTNYYRLYQVDFDGQSEYSPIRSVTIEGNLNVKMHIYPNPTLEGVTIRPNEPADSDIPVIISNQMGQVVNKTTLSYNNFSHYIDMTDLKAGTYFIELQYSASRNEVFRILKIQD